MAEFVLDISKPGYDAIKETDDRNFVYRSKYNGLKIKTHNVKAASGTVAHGISGYIPSFLNFVEDGTGKYRFANLLVGGDQWADSTNLNFTAANNYYFIFIDQAG